MEDIKKFKECLKKYRKAFAFFKEQIIKYKDAFILIRDSSQKELGEQVKYGLSVDNLHISDVAKKIISLPIYGDLIKFDSDGTFDTLVELYEKCTKTFYGMTVSACSAVASSTHGFVKESIVLDVDVSDVKCNPDDSMEKLFLGARSPEHSTIRKLLKIEFDFKILLDSIDKMDSYAQKIIEALDNDKIKCPVEDLCVVYIFLVLEQVKPEDAIRVLGRIVRFNSSFAQKEKNHKIVNIMLDSNLASFFNDDGTLKDGCSIDELVKWITELHDSSLTYMQFLLNSANIINFLLGSEEQLKDLLKPEEVLDKFYPEFKEKIIDACIQLSRSDTPADTPEKANGPSLKYGYSCFTAAEQRLINMVDSCFDSRKSSVIGLPECSVYEFIDMLKKADNKLYSRREKDKMITVFEAGVRDRIGKPSILWILDEMSRDICLFARIIKDTVDKLGASKIKYPFSVTVETNNIGSIESKSVEVEITEDELRKIRDCLKELNDDWELVWDSDRNFWDPDGWNLIGEDVLTQIESLNALFKAKGLAFKNSSQSLKRHEY